MRGFHEELPHFSCLLVLLVVVKAFSAFGLNHGSIPNREARSVSPTALFGAKPSDKDCIDFCKVHPRQCQNGGTCIVHKGTCQTSCACAPGTSGRWCEIKRTDGVKRGQDTETNPAHFTNGFNPSKGANINATFEKASMSTNRPINPNFRPTKGQNASVLLGNLTKDASHGFFTWGESKTGGDSLAQGTNSSRQRSCFPGFTCVHGHCDQEALRNKTLKCICEDNYVDTLCDKPCPLNCGKNGQCWYVKNNTYQCVCEWRYQGAKCDQLVPDPIPGEGAGNIHWYVLGPSLGAIGVVLAVLIAVPYWMWKRRLVVVLKIVHFFQKYEDDDGKDYDAFVSYKATPTDEKFVLQQLLPRLEGELQYKLCLHFRDFLPGEAIANNIVKAIESSRRTIMVLSPSYVESEWCRMEYQKAQHEMLKLKHKIIPIVLEDISQVKTMDKNLKCILNSVTYIDWPGEENSKRLDRFWKKLAYSLPKTTSSSSSSSPSSSSFSTPSSSSSPPLEISQESSSGSGTILAPSEVPKQVVQPLARSTTPRPEKKRRDLKYFVQSMFKRKFYDRQDSSSSQAALVDDESSGIGSLDSCSDTQATDGTNSTCSTPERMHVISGRPSGHGDLCSCSSAGPGRKCSGLHGPVSLLNEHTSGSYIAMGITSVHPGTDSETDPYVTMGTGHNESGSYVDMNASGSYVDMGGDGLYLEMNKSNPYVEMKQSDMYVDMKRSIETVGVVPEIQHGYSGSVYANTTDYTNSPPGKYVSMNSSCAAAYDSLSTIPSEVSAGMSYSNNASLNEKSSFCSAVCARRSQFTGKDSGLCCEECKRLRDKSDNNRVRISVVSGNADACRVEKLCMEPEKCHACSSGQKELKRTRSLHKTQKEELNRQLVRQNWVGSLGRHSGIVTRDCMLTLDPESPESYCNKSYVNDERSECDQEKFYMDVCEKV